MKKYLKLIGAAIICVVFFFYGMASLQYKIFPFYQIIQVKNFFDHTQNRYQETEVINTVFQRLLVKKVYLNKNLYKGGGIYSVDNFLFLMTNKAKMKVFDTKDYSIIGSTVPEIPMNLEEFERSKYYEKDDFREEWLRVSGVYAEKTGEHTYQLFATHHYYDKIEECVLHNISHIKLEIKSDSVRPLTVWNTIFSARPCIDLDPKYFPDRLPYAGNISGGKIIEHNDSTLMVTVGDYDRNGLNKTEAYSQNPNVPYGKIILVNKVTGNWSIYSSGHRNILGIYKNKKNIIWATENGPRGGDELNVIEEGANYGWPKESYGVWYLEEFKIGDDGIRGLHNDYKKPVHSWVPSIAPNNLVQIEGEKFDHWNGDLIIGTMRDRSLQRVRINDDNEAMYVERIPLEEHRVRDMTLLGDKSIALITDDGFLIIIDDGGSVFEEMDSRIQQKKLEMNRYDAFSEDRNDQNSVQLDRRETAAVIFNRHCGNCHSMDNKNGIGPHLNNLFTREVGSLEDFNYSTVLMQDTRDWNSSLLRSFLMEPSSEFPNNQMQQISLNRTELDSIISYIQRSSNQ